MSEKIKLQKIFLNAMDSWFSNFIIEMFRTDHLPESKSQTEIMGTINDKRVQRLPMYFKPKIINFEFNTGYENPKEVYYPIYNYISNMYYKNRITAEMTYEEAYAIADELTNRIMKNVEEYYQIPAEYFYEYFELYYKALH